MPCCVRRVVVDARRSVVAAADPETTVPAGVALVVRAAADTHHVDRVETVAGAARPRVGTGSADLGSG